MKCVAILACGWLAAALLSPALAQDNEAEKLFRDMEKKVRAARAFEVSFTYQVKGRETKGGLLVTQDNKARLKLSGSFGGERNAAFELVSDGKQLKTKGAKLSVMPSGLPAVELGGRSERQTPKHFHAALGAYVSRGGVGFTVHGLPYLIDTDIDPDADGSGMKVSDLKLGAAEKIGEREAKVVHYRLGKGDGCPDDVEITLWIDAKTLLPLKRSFVSKRDPLRITDIYHEFKLDPKIDAKAFELPK